MRKQVIGVIGGHDCTPEVEQIAQEIGKKLSKVANYLVCGGLSGTMQAVCKGFKAENNVTIGIIPSYDKKDANSYIDIVIPTGLGLARNVLVVKTADVVVALPGKSGTLSEIAYCLQFGIPVISLAPLEIPQDKTMTTKFLTGLNSWDIEGVIKVKTAEEAAKRVSELLK